MTELELVGVLNNYFQDGISLSVATYAIAALIAFIFACFGSFLSSYMKKSGELKAVSERLDETIEQLRNQTEVVEDVKTRLSNKIWIDQQKWEFRKSIFIELIKLLLQIKSSCEEAEEYLDRVLRLGEMDNGNDYEKAKGELISDAENIYNGKVCELTGELKKLLNEKGLLFLSDNVIAVLREYFKAEEIRQIKIYNEFEEDLKAGRLSIYDAGHIDSYEQSLYHKSKAAKKAYMMVVKAAKNDLQINS